MVYFPSVPQKSQGQTFSNPVWQEKILEFEKALMLGSQNSAFVPVVFEAPAVAFSTMKGGALYQNTGATNEYITYRLPLPTNRGGKKLYICGVKISVYLADANDYLDRS